MKGQPEKLPAHIVRMELSSRYYALMSPDRAQELHVALIGAGAIGSFAAVALTKLGVARFTVWDMDTIEPANVGVQAYDTTHMGMRKTAALAAILDATTQGAARVTQRNKFTPSTILPKDVDVVVASLDNIPTRELVWAAARRLPTGKPILYIDPRMGAEVVEMRATVLNEKGRGFTPIDKVAYEKSFHKNVPPAPCGAVSTPYCASAAGALVAARVKQFVAGEAIPTWVAAHIPNLNVVKGVDNVGHLKTRPRKVQHGGGSAKRAHGARRSGKS